MKQELTSKIDRLESQIQGKAHPSTPVYFYAQGAHLSRRKRLHSRSMPPYSTPETPWTQPVAYSLHRELEFTPFLSGEWPFSPLLPELTFGSLLLFSWTEMLSDPVRLTRPIRSLINGVPYSSNRPSAWQLVIKSGLKSILMWLGLFFTMTLMTTLILTGAGCWLNKQSVDFMYNKYVNVNGLEHFFPTAVKTKITTWIVGLFFFCFFKKKLVQISRLLIENIFSRMT